MRILQVSDFYPPTPGGLEAHVARLSEQLRVRGHDVLVVAIGSSAVAPDGQVTVHQLRLSLDRLPVYANDRAYHPPWPDPAFARALLDIARQHRPDIIHAHGWSEFSAIKVGKRLDVPVVVTLHDYGLCCPIKSLSCGGRACRRIFGLCCLTCAECEQSILRRAALAAAIRLGRRRLLRGVTRFLAVSEYVARTHRALGVSDGSISVIPNFVDDLDAAQMPPPIGGPILFVGPAASHKGRWVLERAYQALSPTVRPRLWLVGDNAPSTDINQVAGVDHLGRRPGTEMSVIQRAASMTVVPSIWHDPCPTVALEASAAGRPVIASAVGGLTDIVIPDVTGLLVPPNDPSALTGALNTLIDDPLLGLKLGAAGRDRITHHFTAAVIVPRIEKLYREARA